MSQECQILNQEEVLKKQPLFRGISEEQMQEVLTALNARVTNYKKGEYIMDEGDPVRYIGIVLEGSVQVLQDDYYGNRTIINSLGKGSMFAEAFACAFVTELPVSVLAQSDCRILLLDKDVLLLGTGKDQAVHDILLRNLLSIVARKNMFLNKRLRYSSHKTTREKLMAYLMDEAKRQNSSEFDIPFDRQSLADYLGVERSAMSAEIGKLVRDGEIETQRSHFKLL